MGPRFCKRGNSGVFELPSGDEIASIGPRFCKRGNFVMLAVVVGHNLASIGPRFCKRGNFISTSRMRPPPGLQLGHAFVSVETRVRVPLPAPMNSFNWATLL